MSRHRHDRAGAVAREHVVGDPDRNFLASDRIGGIRAGEGAGLLFGKLSAFKVGFVRHPCFVGFNAGALFGCRDGVEQFMLRREDQVGREDDRAPERGRDAGARQPAGHHGIGMWPDRDGELDDADQRDRQRAERDHLHGALDQHARERPVHDPGGDEKTGHDVVVGAARGLVVVLGEPGRGECEEDEDRHRQHERRSVEDEPVAGGPPTDDQPGPDAADRQVRHARPHPEGVDVEVAQEPRRHERHEHEESEEEPAERDPAVQDLHEREDEDAEVECRATDAPVPELVAELRRGRREVAAAELRHTGDPGLHLEAAGVVRNRRDELLQGRNIVAAVG